MRIAICDDDRAYLSVMVDYIKRWTETSAIKNVVYHTFLSAEGLIYSSDDIPYDLFFVDLILSGMNGYQLTKRIREGNKDAIVVFITSTDSFLASGYEVGIYRYIKKPFDYDSIASCLTYAYEQTENLGKSLLVKSGGEYYRILQKNIVYLTTGIHNITIYTITGDNYTFSYKKRFEVFLEELDNLAFLRCHRGYIVNMMYVNSFSSKSISLISSDEEIPIGRLYHDQTINALRRFFNYKFE